MKVLIGVDGSAHADATLEFVKKMKWAADDSFTVVSAAYLVFGTYTEPFTPSGVDTGAWLEELTKAGEELVTKGARRLTEVGLKAKGRVVRGDPREALLDEARREGADLIVVGSHGRTGLTKIVMGSVASHVVTHAPCSVLVVKAPATT